MRLLYILNVANKVNNFSHTSMLAAKELGIEFHIAGNWSYPSEEAMRQDEAAYGIRIHQVDIDRSPYSPKNIVAYKQIVKIIREEHIDCIHCNTPVGGLLGRLAGKKCGIKPVIYQAHGFHFYKGAPLLNWLIYYPIERWLAHMTDAIITINTEDHAFAQMLRLRKANSAYHIPGVGVNSMSFYPGSPSQKAVKRQKLGLPEDTLVIISSGELNKNKNNTVLLSALAKCTAPAHLVLCGVGPEESNLRKQAQMLGISDRVHFLGYRTDLKELLAAADLYAMASFREGLSRAIMEAMACGLPCIVSNIRGNADLIKDGKGGFLCPPADSSAFSRAIDTLAAAPALCQDMGHYNLTHISSYDTASVVQKTAEVYNNVLLCDKENLQ